MDEVSPAQKVQDLIHGHVTARCLHVVARFGVADALGDEPESPHSLAEKTGLHPDALHRMLRLLAAQGIFAQEADGFVHTEASQVLRGDHPLSLRNYACLIGSQINWESFGQLAEVARAGHPVGGGFEARMKRLAQHPEEAELFNAAMRGKAARVVPAVVEAVDFDRFGRVCDVGGGSGHLIRAIVERTRSTTGILFEVPHVIAAAKDIAGPRLELAAGDFFTGDLPAADCYVLMDVLHDWNDEDARRIVTNIRRAAMPGASLFVIETMVSDRPGQYYGKILDVSMLVLTGGRERSAAELETVLEGTGFRLIREIETPARYSIAQAEAI